MGHGRRSQQCASALALLELKSQGRRWRLILAPIGVLLLLVVFYLVAGPMVRSVSPAPEANDVPRGQELRVEFSRAMEPASVERRLTIEPSVDGRFRWQGRSLVFVPSDGWPEGQRMTVRLAAGARSNLFLPLLSRWEWNFQVRRIRVVYLLPEDGTTTVKAQAKTEAEGEYLVEAALDVLDYALAAEGGQVAVLRREAGGAVIQLFGNEPAEPGTVVHRCSEDRRCSGLALAPNGAWLAWEEQPLTRSATGVLQPGPKEVWSKALAGNGGAVRLAEGPAERHSPHWIDGETLAYYDAGRGSLVVTGRSAAGWSELVAIENSLGEHWTWSPDGRFVVFPEVQFLNGGAAGGSGVDFFSHLYRVEVETGLRTDLSAPAAGLVEDASPAYSPDGLWLAFARKSLELDEWSLGRQLWLMRADGTAARALTDDPAYNHGQIAWRPDSSGLAFVRTDGRRLDQPSEIWWYDLESESRGLLVEGGYAPRWIR